MPRRNKLKPHAPSMPPRGHTGKRRFISKQGATQAITASKQLNPDISLHAYRCLDCQGWHLTSSDQNDIV